MLFELREVPRPTKLRLQEIKMASDHSLGQVIITPLHLPRRLLRITSGETGLSFLSALMSSSSRS